jgi:hypothetical protein
MKAKNLGWKKRPTLKEINGEPHQSISLFQFSAEQDLLVTV